MITLLLTVALAPQGGQEFGWNEPLWSTDFPDASEDIVIATDDFSGDGIAEVVSLSGLGHGSLQVVNGADGSIWFSLDLPWGDPHSYKWSGHDLDGDGLPEFVLQNYISYQGDGQIAVVHGGDGLLMWEVWGREAGDEFGRYVYFLDGDGDGLMDVISGAQRNGKLVALNGKTGARLWQLYGQGRSFHAAAPDLNGDGIEDFILGGRSQIIALSGGDGATIWVVPTQVLRNARNWQAVFPDLNQDGTPDVLVLNPDQNFGQFTDAGVLEAVNGRSGATLWSGGGTANDMRLGSNAVLQDLTGDGIADVLSGYAPHPALIDGADGSIVWDFVSSAYSAPDDDLFLQDFIGNGRSDLLIPVPTVAFGPLDQLLLIDTVQGTQIWSLDTQWPGENFFTLDFADFNQDGATDILASSSSADVAAPNDGLVRIISGPTGQELWHFSGDVANAQLGGWNHSAMILEEVDATPGLDLLISSTGGGIQRTRYALAGQSGAVLWSQIYDQPKFPYFAWTAVDLNGDGYVDVLETQANLEGDTRFLGFDRQSGAVLVELVFNTDRWNEAKLLTPLADLDGDGIEELLINRPTGFNTFRLETYSGADGGWTSGLSLSADQISIASGGVIQTDVHFPPTQAGWSYQLLLSEVGNQTTNLGGLQVPLSPGFWLTHTYMGNYPPGMIFNPLGSLNNDGNAQITLDALPNQIAPAFAGTTMYLAVISAEPGMGWSFSSGSAAVQILP
jgi:FG-GAP-like repeat